jgi:hypothetical protein
MKNVEELLGVFLTSALLSIIGTIPCYGDSFTYGRDDNGGDGGVFQALRNRARKAKAARKPNLADIKPGSVIENIAQTRRLAETTLGPTLVAPSSAMEEERPTNTGSGSQVFQGDLVF